MKSIKLLIPLVLISQVAIATTPDQFVKTYQSEQKVTCKYTHSSKLSFCLNYTCLYNYYYACENEQNYHNLVLKVRSIQFPGEAAEKSVLNYSVQ